MLRSVLHCTGGSALEVIGMDLNDYSRHGEPPYK